MVSRNLSMELPLYSFEGTMELHEWFQRLEEYFEYTRFQKEHDKALIASLHLTSQAYTWAKRQYKYWKPSFPWDTFENFKEELEFEDKWNYKERKALELEYEEEYWGVEDDDSKLETISIGEKADCVNLCEDGQHALLVIHASATLSLTKYSMVNRASIELGVRASAREPPHEDILFGMNTCTQGNEVHGQFIKIPCSLFVRLYPLTLAGNASPGA
eukprot:Gb_25468 [translate_table: standard]